MIPAPFFVKHFAPHTAQSPHHGASQFGLDTCAKVHFRVQFMTLQWLGDLPHLIIHPYSRNL